MIFGPKVHCFANSWRKSLAVSRNIYMRWVYVVVLTWRHKISITVAAGGSDAVTITVQSHSLVPCTRGHTNRPLTIAPRAQTVSRCTSSTHSWCFTPAAGIFWPSSPLLSFAHIEVSSPMLWAQELIFMSLLVANFTTAASLTETACPSHKWELRGISCIHGSVSQARVKVFPCSHSLFLISLYLAAKNLTSLLLLRQ